MDTLEFSIPRRNCNICGDSFPLTPDYWHKDKKAAAGLSYACKECAKKKARDWLANNRERASSGKRQYYAENKTKFQAYRHVNAEYIAEKKREWRKNNPDKVKRHKSESQKRNRTSANARTRRYSHKYPEKVLARIHARRARKLNNGGTYTQADIDLQYRSQKGLCWHCAAPVGEQFHIDHLIPLVRGGTNAPDNIVISCPTCNLSKGSKLPQEWNGRLF